MKILGIFHSFSDPSAALVVDGRVVAYVEEERLIRNKHAGGRFPIQSVEYVLKAGGEAVNSIDCIAQAWDVKKYDNGTIARHYEEINSRYKTDAGDVSYQSGRLKFFSTESQKGIILQNLRRHYGEIKFPDIVFVSHHFAHACTAYFNSGMDETLVLTIDGSGEEITTAWWTGRGGRLKLLHEIKVPHSLGWFYSAFTEYLGFRAYDGEYKVMGLAAYGGHKKEIKDKIDSIVWYDGKGGFETNPELLSRGPRKYSSYYPDALQALMGHMPRPAIKSIGQWHRDCAFSVQQRLEEIVLDMTAYWTGRTGLRNLAISGGVALNVKMNGRLFESGLLDRVFVYPVCADAGSSIGAALAVSYKAGCLSNIKLNSLFLGPAYSDDEIRRVLTECKVTFTEEESIELTAARLISEGKIVGWFQGSMEAGPRALGARSILADPRSVESRDKVNNVIKYREPWRPFTPSMTQEGADMYFDRHTDAPFMIMTFKANERAEKDIPAVVHIDKTARPQIVSEGSNKEFYNLIKEFRGITGIPVLLNTSFNVRGEPIVCSPRDALRTFFATGLDALAIGNFLISKELNSCRN